MRQLCTFLLAVAAVAVLTAAAKAPDFFVRFHVETTSQDSATFAMPAEFHNPTRKGFVERTPSISERHISGIYPFRAEDGTFGCVLKLDPDGRIALEGLTTQQRGRILVAYVGTKKGMHQVIDMQIDKQVLDGIITIPRGLTPLEIVAMRKAFKPLLPKGATPLPKKGMKLPWTH
jgi:hypothetical protein